MKQSGIDWIGEIPDDWKTRQIRYLFSLRDERNYKPLSEVNLISVYTDKGVLQHSDIEQTTGNKAQNADGYKHVYKNDLVVNIILCWMGALGISDFDGVTSPAYDVYAPKDLNTILPKYYHYLFRTPQFNGKCYTEGRGIMQMRWRTYSSEFKSIKVPLPPKAIQQRIAEYLDKKVSEIDSIIEESKKSIEEYKAWKQSIIFEAVTGKNLNCKKKDSGIEWIGEIPEGWEIRQIRNVILRGKNGIKIGPFGSTLTNKTESNYPYNIYGQANLVSNDFSFTKNTVSKQVFEELKNYEVIAGDICLSMMGTIGKCRTVPKGIKQGIMDSHLIKIRLDAKIITNSYFEYVYDKDYSGLCYQQMQHDKKGSIMDGLNTTIVKSLLIPLPSITEQETIAKFLDSKCSQIDSLIDEKESLIVDLMEYKKSLIFEVVTGKRSV